MRLPRDIVDNKPDEFFTNLARLNWFNGVVFDGHSASEIKKIKKITSYFHPKSRFGHFGETEAARTYDFVILPIEDPDSNEQLRKQIQKAKGLNFRQSPISKKRFDHSAWSIMGLVPKKIFTA